VRLRLTAGPTSDGTPADLLIDSLSAEHLLADRGCPSLTLPVNGIGIYTISSIPSVSKKNRVGEGTEFWDGRVIKGIEDGEQYESASQQGGGGNKARCLHLPAGQAHEKLPGGLCLLGLLRSQAPHQDTGLGGDQQTLE